MFARPVDWKKLGLNDYPEIVKNPMDITTLQKNLNASLYPNISQLLQDANLIFENCRLYNGQADDGYYINAADTSE